MSFIEELKISYETTKVLYDLLCEEVDKQLNYLLDQEEIILATPITSRVKIWTSILRKCEKYKIEPSDIREINDIAGLRVISLFQRDVNKICTIINEHFTVFRMENTGERLLENQFGYGSIHFEVTPKDDWFQVPTLKRLQGLSIEIQVRTVAQHIWAAASHKLQYKQENHVPIPLRRAINRTAAILEMVDLEFERLLNERDTYIEDIIEKPNEDATLNIEILKDVLDSALPRENKDSEEDYNELLNDLGRVEVDTKKKIVHIFEKHLAQVIEKDKRYVEEGLDELQDTGQTNEEDRIKTGVYFTHVGLTREVLSQEFGDTWRKKKKIELRL
ncbi:GTP pyrophosphokinase family protein [Cohnella sp.]|uniref:GTP pyrophosphokinase n=1 Tax=Cohnella sp. TaxID=1883426 RepID=UPI00370478EC